MRASASAAGAPYAVRYDSYRSATTLGTFFGLACGDPPSADASVLCAAMDIARDVRSGHCTVEGIRTA